MYVYVELHSTKRPLLANYYKFSPTKIELKWTDFCSFYSFFLWFLPFYAFQPNFLFILMNFSQSSYQCVLNWTIVSFFFIYTVFLFDSFFCRAQYPVSHHRVNKKKRQQNRCQKNEIVEEEKFKQEKKSFWQRSQFIHLRIDILNAWCFPQQLFK